MPTTIGVRSACGSAHRKEIEIPTRFKLPVRLPMWIAGFTVCLLAATGAVAIVRSMPDSYANIPDKIAPSIIGAEPNRLEDAQAEDTHVLSAATQASTNRQNRARCPECGIIESMRQIERSGEVGRHDAVGVRIARGVSDDAIAATSISGTGYEFTVRFRDGSTALFNQTSPHTWQLGSRVVVVGRSNVLNN